MSKILLYLVCISSLLFKLEANEKPYVIMGSREAGMFSICFDVLSLIHGYHEGLYSGIEVNFEKQGLYYDKSMDENWWNYYFMPIQFGEKVNPIHVVGDPPNVPGPIEKKLNRDLAKYYISSYIRLRPEIQKEIYEYYYKNFLDTYIISVHYRGTDKIEHEAFEVPYEKVVDEITQVSSQCSGNWKIFIATDEKPFLDFMICKYGDKVIYFDCERSSNSKPLHISSKNPYLQGKEALIDCILLSMGNHLIRTASNLSTWSTYFNPYIPISQLSEVELH